jgi:cytochrome c551/c552
MSDLHGGGLRTVFVASNGVEEGAHRSAVLQTKQRVVMHRVEIALVGTCARDVSGCFEARDNALNVAFADGGPPGEFVEAGAWLVCDEK